MTTAYIGLGSNLNDPIRQLRAALAALALLPESAVKQVSGAYSSGAVGPGVQPPYLNAVAQLDTRLPPQRLLSLLQSIEQAQGRIRTIRWGARSLDLDILLYGEEHIDTPTLTVPHPALGERNFVLYPLADICGTNFVLPDGTDLGTLISRCPRNELLNTGLQLQQQS